MKNVSTPIINDDTYDNIWSPIQYDYDAASSQFPIELRDYPVENKTSSDNQINSKELFTQVLIKLVNYRAYIINPEELLELMDVNQLIELFNLLTYYTNKYKPIFGTPSLEVVLDDRSAPSYLKIIILDCNWEQWGTLDEDLLERENFLKGYLMIECVKGLIE